MQKASARLVTQTLVISALRVTSRSPESISWNEITNLAALIDILCFFDELHVLGRWDNVHLRQTPSEMSDFIAPIVRTDYVAEERADDLRVVAASHLRSVLEDDGGAEVRRVFGARLSRDAVQIFERSDSDTDPWGAEWTTSGPTLGEVVGRNEYREEVFMRRTFLYLAYADVFGMALTPDAGRHDFVSALLRREDMVADQLLHTLDKAYSEVGGTSFKYIRERISPVAALVINRAAEKSTSVALETSIMREELKAIRTTLRETEDALAFGSHDDAQRAELRWNAALDEVRRSYGAEPDLLTVRKALNFGRDLASVADASTSYKSWIGSLLALPLDVISRVLARRTVVDLHRLRPEVPGGGRLNQSIVRLFGDLPRS